MYAFASLTGEWWDGSADHARGWTLDEAAAARHELTAGEAERWAALLASALGYPVWPVRVTP